MAFYCVEALRLLAVLVLPRGSTMRMNSYVMPKKKIQTNKQENPTKQQQPPRPTLALQISSYHGNSSISELLFIASSKTELGSP